MSQKVTLSNSSSSGGSCCGNCTPQRETDYMSSQQPTFDFDYLMKIVLMGEFGVGKTSLLHRFTKDEYIKQHISTCGVDFAIKRVHLDGKMIKLLIWDTAGQERFRVLTPPYFRGTHCFILVYDVTNQKSFDNISFWLEEIDKYPNENAKKLLVGNKCDLTTQKVVDYTTAKAYADQLGIPFMEISAKDATNVEVAFLTMVAEVKKHLKPLPRS